jgi:hypothetical protein
LPSGYQIRIEGFSIWIGISDFNFVAITRSGPAADCQNDSGRVVRTRKYRHVVAEESTRSTQNKLWLRS